MGAGRGAWRDTSAVVIIDFDILDFNRLAAGGLRKQPAGGEGNRRLFIFSVCPSTSACAGSGLRKVYESTVNCALLFPFAVTLRRSRDARINQRIDSLPCPALFSMFPGRQALSSGSPPYEGLTPKFHGRGFHQTTTIGPAGALLLVGLCGRGRRVSGELEVGSG